jgi:prepilin-type N-terminal cleavage/methylation domain-containing protein
MRATLRRSPLGLTMIEMLVTMTLIGVLAALAAPSMAGYIARKRVDGQANEVMTTFRYARSLPVQKRDIASPYFISFGSASTFTCYAVYSARFVDDCDCTRHPQNTCSTFIGRAAQPVAFRTVILPNSDGISVTANISSLKYDSLSGLPLPTDTALSVDTQASNGGTLRVNVNGTGLPTICEVRSGSVVLHPTYPACS